MSGAVGQPLRRADGEAKVMGRARYAADFSPEHFAHAVIVGSSVARGRLRVVDTEGALAVPGVLAVLTPDDLPPLLPVGEDLRLGGALGESSIPHFTHEVVYAGQHLAVVVGETLEGANLAARLLRLTLDAEPPHLGMDGEPERPGKMLAEPEVRRGDVNVTRPDVTIEATYTTPVEHHHPIETCATVAEWQGDDLVLHDATRWVYGSRGAVADMLGLPRERVWVVSPFVGGAFGSKAFLWAHLAGAALAARAVGRPVKLELSRAQMTTANGHRARTEQQLTLGASADGRLLVARHRVLSETSPVSEMTEPCGRLTPELYTCENVEVIHRRVRRNVTTPGPMRAPGEAPGSFALESAMDELASALNLDPLELRLRNYAHINPQGGRAYSGKHLDECYRLGAERFGWARRDPQPGSMRDGELLVGWGMATTTYPANRGPTSARARIELDGRVSVSCATHEVGTGTSTVIRQLAADVLDLKAGDVAFEWGDSELPFAPVTGASQTTASVGSAVMAAAQAAHAELVRRAVADPASPLHGLSPEGIVSRGGRLELAADPARFESYADLLGRGVLPFVEVVAQATPGEEREKFSFSSFGALFVEVRVEPLLGTVRVSRVVGVYDVGRVLNPRTTRSQFRGGILMGLGMALLEETEYDPGTGLPLNDNLSDYHIPVCADTPEIDVSWLDIPDPHMGELGARGLGEIGIVGTAAAVANAVYHATGKRIRDLPITPDKLR